MNPKQEAWHVGKTRVNRRDPYFSDTDIMNKSNTLRIARVAGLGDHESKDNADFIVRAVNSHQELLENLKNIEASFTRRCFRTGCNAAEELMLKAVRDAIAHAEGGK